MKKFLCIALTLLSCQAFGQGLLDRFTDPEKGRTVFIEKGHYALGISGGYHNFSVSGENGSGYAMLSILNIGSGELTMYEATPSFSYFLADDLSLGVRLDYDGYTLNTDIRADFSQWLNLNFMSDPETEEQQEAVDMLSQLLNVRLSGRHMVRNAWGTSLALRKYLSFFGSKTFAIFGEARLYGNYGRVESCPLDKNYQQVTSKMRISDVWSSGLKLGGGLCVKLRDNSAFTISVPIVGATYSYTKQLQEHPLGSKNAHMSQFTISRDIDFLAVQVGYTRYIQSKKRR